MRERIIQQLLPQSARRPAAGGVQNRRVGRLRPGFPDGGEDLGPALCPELIRRGE